MGWTLHRQCHFEAHGTQWLYVDCVEPLLPHTRAHPVQAISA